MGLNTYPVLLLLVLSIQLQVAANAGVAGGAGHAGDAVRWGLPVDTQLSLGLRRPVNGIKRNWGRERKRKMKHRQYMWYCLFYCTKVIEISPLRFVNVGSGVFMTPLMVAWVAEFCFWRSSMVFLMSFSSVSCKKVILNNIKLSLTIIHI